MTTKLLQVLYKFCAAKLNSLEKFSLQLYSTFFYNCFYCLAIIFYLGSMIPK